MLLFQSYPQPVIPKHPITTHTQADPKKLEATLHWQEKRQTDRSRNCRTDEVPFLAFCSHFTRKNTRFLLRLPDQNTNATFMLCIRSFKNRIELRTQEQPLVGKNVGGTIRAWNDPSRTDEVPFFAGCSHFARKNTKLRAQVFFPKQNPCNIHSAIPMRSCSQKFKNRIGLRTQEQQLVSKHIGRTMKRPSRTRRTDEVPFFAGCSHFTRKKQVFVLRLPPQNITHASFMQPFQCDLQQQLQEPHRTTDTGTTTRWKKHRRNNSRMKRPQPHQPRGRGTFLRRLQPLYTEKHTVSCPGVLTKKPMLHSCCSSNPIRNRWFQNTL